MRVTELLMQDHDEVRELFRGLRNESGAERRLELLRRVASDLIIHSKVEEELFYSALEDTGDLEAERLVAEARSEHELTEDLIERLLSTDGPDDDFDRTVTALERSVEGHAREEEARMFPVAERTLGVARLEEIGRAVERRRSGLKAA